MTALVGYRNLIDGAALSVAAGTVAGYPVSNLQVRQLSETWRGIVLNSPIIVIDFGAAKAITLVGILGINASGATRSDDAVIKYSNDGVNWTSELNVLLPVDAGSLDLPRHLIMRIPTVFGSKRSTRYLSIQPKWGVSLSSFYEIGRLFVSDAIEFPDGPDSTWTLLGDDTGNLDESRGHQAYEDKGERGRVMRARFGAMKTEQAYGFAETATSAAGAPSVDDLFMAAGRTGEILYVPRADNPLWIRRTAIYGHLTPDSLSLPHLAGNRYSWDFTIEEEH
jgi:hypothetical protein